ncbi:MAG: hypothetical protein JWN14_386 [Chthonomonadales bacterium]|nr:hypothetical protein [Chthonomonadales bacterium]
MISSPNKAPSTVGIVSAGVCILVLAIGVFFWNYHKYTPYDDLAFNAAQWRSAHTSEEKAVRAKMAGDIRKHYLKTGMTEAQVTALLGPPDKLLGLDGFAPPDRPDVKQIYQYDMGEAWGAMAGQHENLRIWFNANGRYISSYTQVD